MEVFDFMPYTYYTRMTASGGKRIADSSFYSPTSSLAHQLTREALIKSLFAFILEFLCNARNGLTRIASYLRKPMTKQCIKILIKENSMN